MRAHVKTRHIKIDIDGKIPTDLISCLKKNYGKKVRIITDDEDEFVNVFETEWFKKTSMNDTAGQGMRFYRELHKMTQEELGRKLGGISRQNVCHMEQGRRQISLHTAKLLSRLFNVSIERFIDNT